VSRMPSKSFRCPVVSESVSITLRRRNTLTERGERGTLFVACSEKDCQYVDVNEPPCPLTLTVFTAEINERAIR
jgi:hypothetical protein